MMNTDLFGDFQKLLQVDVLGRAVEMPEHNSLLRGFQFASPETVPYGRFCWNGSCNNCTVTVRNGTCESKGRPARWMLVTGCGSLQSPAKFEGCYNLPRCETSKSVLSLIKSPTSSKFRERIHF